jgi:hypothetical protein
MYFTKRNFRQQGAQKIGCANKCLKERKNSFPNPEKIALDDHDDGPALINNCFFATQSMKH